MWCCLCERLLFPCVFLGKELVLQLTSRKSFFEWFPADVFGIFTRAFPSMSFYWTSHSPSFPWKEIEREIKLQRRKKEGEGFESRGLIIRPSGEGRRGKRSNRVQEKGWNRLLCKRLDSRNEGVKTWESNELLSPLFLTLSHHHLKKVEQAIVSSTNKDQEKKLGHKKLGQMIKKREGSKTEKWTDKEVNRQRARKTERKEKRNKSERGSLFKRSHPFLRLV